MLTPLTRAVLGTDAAERLRTVSGGEGLSSLLRPRIEAAFVKREVLLAHLDDLLDDADFVGGDRAVAVWLRERVERMAGELRSPGESAEDVLTLEPRDAIEDIQAPGPFNERLLEAARLWRGRDAEIANPVVQRIYAEVRKSLAEAADYVGEVRDTFDVLVLQVIPALGSICGTAPRASASPMTTQCWTVISYVRPV